MVTSNIADGMLLYNRNPGAGTGGLNGWKIDFVPRPARSTAIRVELVSYEITVSHNDQNWASAIQSGDRPATL